MHLLIIPSVVLSLASSCLSSALTQTVNGPTGTTRNGTYVGVHVPQLSQDIFRGIPFASAPRFRTPQSLNSAWKGVRPAIEPGLTCAGFGTNTQFGWPIGEECLNLNIVRPQGTKSGDKLPVLVWLYGGGFAQGSNRDPAFNTSFIVQTSLDIGKPVIVVSINYRLSGFGFLAGKQARQQGVLNLGLRDSWKSFEWISENIAGFGGDPKKVTVWGESAGAFSISWLLTAYGGNHSNLFQRAIMASGTAFGIPLGDPAVGEAVYNGIANATGCLNAIDSLQCLREVPFPILNATIASLGAGFQPTLDGDLLRNSPIYAFTHSPPLVAPVSIITGCNSEEGISQAVLGQTNFNTTDQIASNLLTPFLGFARENLTELFALYPDDNTTQYPPYQEPMSLDWPALTATVGVQSGSQTRRVYGIMGDLVIMAGRRFTAAMWSKVAAGKKAYSFRWDVYPSTIPLVFTPGLGVGFAQHGAELSYQFRLPYISGSPYPPLPKIDSMQKVSYAMQAHWVAFAATGNPNSHGLSWIPQWPAYEDAKPAQNFVYNATLANTLNLHVENDDFRKEGIQWFSDRWVFLA